MLQPALIIDEAVNQNPGSDTILLESCLLALSVFSDREFSIQLSTMDDTIYFFLDQDDVWGILDFLEKHGVKRPVAS